MKKISFLCFLLMNLSVSAQFLTAHVAVDGLTCSACSFVTQKSLMQLPFIEDVQMDLNTHIATLTFKNGSPVAMDRIAQKVVDAGFSVGGFTAEIYLKEVAVSDNFCFEYDGAIFHFIQTKERNITGIATLTFIGKEFMNKKEFKRYKAAMTAVCASGDKDLKLTKTYFITLK